MSKDAILKIDLSGGVSGVYDLLTVFEEIGWQYCRENRPIEYLPFGDKDIFAWQSDFLTREAFQEIVEQKQRCNEYVGVCLYYLDTEIGVTLLAKDCDHIILSLNINRVTQNPADASGATDTNWYYEHLVQGLMENCSSLNFEFKEY